MKKKINTIADIALVAGVSKSTVSRSLNDSPLISVKTKERVKEIARVHQFEAHKGAQCLSLKKTQTLAIISPLGTYKSEIANDPYYLELLKGVIQATTDKKYDLLIGHPVENTSRDVLKYIESNRTDGVIIMGCGIKDTLMSVAGKGAVIFAGADAPENLSSVDCDNYGGGLLAVQHLIEQGCRQIAFLGGLEDGGETKLRYQGYIDGLKAQGLKVEPNQITFGDYSSKAGYEQMIHWLSDGLQLDGLFACSDLMAIGAMEALREKGKIVGEDIAVVGFDDVPMAEYSSPPLTTIRQDIHKIGASVVESLIKIINDDIITKSILPVELVVRKSSFLKK